MDSEPKIIKPQHTHRVHLHLKRGRCLGKYRLEKRLGMGGYCEVWKARDRVEDIWVALKIPLLEINGERDNQKVLREVKLVAQLRHPNILPAKNADIIDGYAVLATEISAGTLADRSRPMAARKIISIILQILDGLTYAHKKHVLHCDVTPSNIFLFPDGKVALGDFGIGLELKGRLITVDDFGTPGYVAPEQAYGKPGYRSDCFSVGLILYEYLTGILPRWPFHWPFKGLERLNQQTNAEFVRFLRQALAVDTQKRFANAEQMLNAIKQAIPTKIKKQLALANSPSGISDWRRTRRQAFTKRYRNVLALVFRCVKCNEPIDERMSFCPWCGTNKNRYDSQSQYNYICPRCHKGMLPQWRYCPWCYGAGFEPSESPTTTSLRYTARCKYCHGKLMRFMRYCPWCHRKIKHPWQVGPFPEICGCCKWSVDSNFWNYCPWCKQVLL